MFKGGAADPEGHRIDSETGEGNKTSDGAYQELLKM